MAISSINFLRVSEGLKTFALLDSLRQNTLKLFEEQQRLATGNRLNAPSDDPVLAAQALDLTTLFERQEQVLESIRTADTFLTVTDSTIGEISGLLIDAHSLALENVETVRLPEEREAAAILIDGIIKQLVEVGNRTYAGTQLFGGRETDSSPLSQEAGGVRYVGDTTELQALVELDQSDSFSLTADRLFVTLSTAVQGYVDLNPALTADTRLADVRGANDAGVRLGTIAITETTGVGVFTVDLSEADVMSDVVDKINDAAATAGSTITASLTATGVQIAGGGNSFTIADPGNGYTASDLGIVQSVPGPGPLVGNDLDPKLTVRTTVAALAGGAGVNLAGGLRLTSGLNTATVDTSTATTVQDIINAINTADGVPARAFINSAGTGIDVLNPLSGAELGIGENGGTTAAELGIRSMHGATPLADLNRGQGMGTVTGADIQVIARDGATVDVDLSSATTIQDVIDAINVASAALGNPVTASLVTTGNGISIADNTAGAGSLAVQNLNYSTAGTDLGLIKSVAVGDLSGDDVNGVIPEGVFTALTDLRDALRAGDQVKIQLASQRLETMQDEINRVHGEIGARSQAMQTRLDLTESAVLATQTLLSEVKDLDYTEAVTTFQQAETTLQANLLAGSRLMQLSLMDFLR